MKYLSLLSVIVCFTSTTYGQFTEQNPPKVLVTHPDTPAAGVDILKLKCIVTLCNEPTRAEILEKAKGVDGILWATHEHLDKEALDAIGPQLKSISIMSAGHEFVDLQEIKKRGIPIGYTPDVLSDAVANMAMGLMIAAGRKFHEGRLAILESKWKTRHQFNVGADIKNSTIGIVGFGSVGQTIAKRLQGFDVRSILYSGHNPKPEANKFHAKFVSFDELIKESDFVFISAPLTNETRGLFNSKIFRKMKPTSVLINIARGPIVDQNALYDALKSNIIFAAGIDVMTPEPLPSDHKLLSLPNLIIAPHSGSATVKTRNDMATIAAQNVLKGLANEPMLSPLI